MIYYFLIYYIFSITFLLKAANEYGSQNNLIEESPKFTKGHRRNREIFYIEMEDHAKEKHKKIKWGDDKVVTFDKQDPPVFISGRTTKPPRSNGSLCSKLFGCCKKNKKSFRVEKYLGKGIVSKKIWYHVWKGYTDYCYFAANNFSPLTAKYLDEINLYRKLHNGKPLVLKSKLSLAAMSQAKKNALHHQITYDGDEMYGSVSGGIDAKFSPILIKLWYDQNRNYIYQTYTEFPSTKHFSAMVWKDSRYVGIGFAYSQGRLYVTLKFWPKGNERFKFRKNVERPNYSKFFSRSFFRY